MDEWKRLFHTKNKHTNWIAGCYCCSLDPKERKIERKRLRRRMKQQDKLGDVA